MTEHDQLVSVRYLVDDVQACVDFYTEHLGVPGRHQRRRRAAEVRRLTDAGLRFRDDVVTGPGGSQVLVIDPSGNLVELFQPAGR